MILDRQREMVFKSGQPDIYMRMSFRIGGGINLVENNFKTISHQFVKKKKTKKLTFYRLHWEIKQSFMLWGVAGAGGLGRGNFFLSF